MILLIVRSLLLLTNQRNNFKLKNKTKLITFVGNLINQKDMTYSVMQF